MGDLIYLDYNATTPVDSVVLEEMLPWFSDGFWNAASPHTAGRRAAEAVEDARDRVAELLGARSRDVVFTSGATEANNIALKGAVEAVPSSRTRVLVGATEHKAVIDVADWLAEQGYPVTTLPVGADGIVDIDAYREVIDDDVAIVSIMLANNETGVIAPIKELADIAHAHGALFHTDGTQALGRIDVDLPDLGVDLASFSAHKAYGPKGMGALYVARGVTVAPLIHGGGHERGMRSGTLNVPGIVGFGVAAEIAGKSLDEQSARQVALTARLVDTLQARLRGVEWIADASPRLPNTASIRFVGADGEAVIVNAPDVAISSGSACTARVPAPSHVLLAMGLSQEAGLECVRFSVGRPTTTDEIDEAASRIAAAVERIRSLDDRARTANGEEGRAL